MSRPESASVVPAVVGDRADDARYRLSLFVSGASPVSRHAIEHARTLCDIEVAGDCDLLVFDLGLNPEMALASRVVVTPTLIRTRPLPERRFVGDLSQWSRVLRALDLPGPSSDGRRSPDPVS